MPSLGKLNISATKRNRQVLDSKPMRPTSTPVTRTWEPARRARCPPGSPESPIHTAVTCNSMVMRKLHSYLDARRYDVFREVLARAELAGHISEFHALHFHAALAMAEESDLAEDYLDMAEVVAASPSELALVAETRAAHDLHQGNPLAAAERCLATIEHVQQTERLWLHLLVALYRLGRTDTLDAALHRLTQLDDECSTRILRQLSSEPMLREVRSRPAFRQLLCKRAG
jgi:hypothetical protein